MIKIYFLSLFLLIGLFVYSQNSTIYLFTQNKINDIAGLSIKNYDSITYNNIDLDSIIRIQVIQKLKNDIESNKTIYYERFDTNYNFYLDDDETEIVNTINNQYYLSIKKEYLKWYQDGNFYLFNDTPKLDKNGEQYYDELGDPLFITTLEELDILKNIFSYNSIEKWNYSTNNFTKENLINEIEIISKGYDSSLYIKSFVTNKVKPHKEKDSLIVLQKNVTYNQLLSPYYRYSDSNMTHYEKNQAIIDYKDYKANHIHKQQYQNFIRSLIKDLLENKLRLTDINKQKLCIKFGYKSILNNIDTIAQYEIGEINGYTIISNELHLDDIIGIQFNEDWYLAKNQFDIVKKVNSISFLVKNVYPETGELLPEPKVLPFKIKFND